MEVFCLSDTYQEIKKELTTLGIIDKDFVFSCLLDGMMVYTYEDESYFHELKVICDLTENDFLYEESFNDLSEKYGIGYFMHHILSKDLNGRYSVIGKKIFSLKIDD